MNPHETGEFGLIQKMSDILGRNAESLLLGIGDDAAILNSSGERQILVTADVLVEGVHFDRRYTPLDLLGWKCLAASISDIAAMGGIPTAAVVTLGLSPEWKVEDVELLYTGLNACAQKYRCAVAGGDTSRSSGQTFINVALLGEVLPGQAVRRSGGKAGHLLGVTGRLGGARCGFEALEAGVQKDFPQSAHQFLRPTPSIEAGQWLAAGLKASAMIDISDGLSSDLGHLCDQSMTGCIIDQVPVTEETVRWAEKTGRDVMEFALNSGEEYVLLFACPRECRESFEQSSAPVEIHWIGRLTPGESGRWVERKGARYPLEARGWDHFSL